MTPRALPRRRLIQALAAGVPWMAVGCSLDGPGRTDFHLLRDDAPTAAPPAAAKIDKVLLVAATGSPALYNTDRMVFSADGKTRAYFQLAFWSERPAQRLLVLAEQRLAASGAFRDVGLSTSGLRGELLLTLRLEELFLDDSPGKTDEVWLVFTAELMDWRTRRLLARRRFARSEPVVQRDAAALARGGSAAAGILLGELVDWAAKAAAAA